MKTVACDSVSYFFDKASAPQMSCESGDTVRFECRDCYNNQLEYDGFDFSKMDMRLNNPITGPLYVNGAQPGDVLRVEIAAIDMGDSGSMCVRLGSGVYEVQGCHCRRFDVKNGLIHFDNGIKIPVRPMVGVMGTAPAGAPQSTQTPGEHGGNMDIKDLGEGAVLYLPVEAEGALLSMGDIHALQGDGETAICALEMAGIVTVRVTVLKDRGDIPTPFVVTPTHYLVTASSPSLDECSVSAARKMHRFLTAHAPLSDAQAAMALSLLGDLRISQVVNPQKGCLMAVPRGILGDCFEV